jgi:hypothetical protein
MNGFRHKSWPAGVFMRIADARFEWRSRHRLGKGEWQPAPTCVAENFGLLAPVLQLSEEWEVAK